MDIRPMKHNPAPAQLQPEREAPAPRPAPGASPASVQAAAAVAGTSQLDQAVEQINKSLRAAGQSVEFAVDPDSKRTVVKVVDQETREVLRQIPTKEALDIAKALDRMQGLLIRNQA
jgi:flagellar protein FlaG